MSTSLIRDRVKETSNSTGTGDFTLNGAYSGFQTFLSAIGTSNPTFYCISDIPNSAWEVGTGIVATSPTRLIRTTVYRSSNGNNPVVFLSGVKDVFVPLPADKAVMYDSGSQMLTLFGGLTVTTGSTIVQDFTANTSVINTLFRSSDIRGGTTDGAPYSFELVTGSLTTSTRLLYGTDNSGYHFSISKNNSGSVADIIKFADDYSANLSGSFIAGGAATVGGGMTIGGAISTVGTASVGSALTVIGTTTLSASVAISCPNFLTPISIQRDAASGLQLQLGINTSSFLGTISTSSDAFIAYNAFLPSASFDQWQQSNSSVQSTLMTIGQGNSGSIFAIYKTLPSQNTGSLTSFWGNPVLMVSSSGKLITNMPITASGFNLPHGFTPQNPVNGDMWTTETGAFIRINGVTKTFTLT